ncbi:MAG: b(o/a)3-type cytochrome-c oxidase subunit 1, partial [Candidatus Hadarchaeum sp.]
FVFILVAFVALALGIFIGLFQALEHAGINLYPIPLLGGYYKNLTLHGVLNALTFTTYFIAGFQLITITRSLERPSRSIAISWVGFGVMTVGLVMAAWAMLSGNANVLYTFYVPMRAHPLHYIGLTLVVIGSWIHSANLFLTWGAWRKANPGVKTPIAAVATLTTWIVWDIATIGVAAEMLIIAIPWSLGLIQNTNPLLARTLFWYFGHPLVYFWLLPAYTSWYAMVPKQAGGKLFSDPLGRLAFMLFILFSVPVGLHHQYTDPGISAAWKGVHAVLTYAVAFPSLITAFTVMASLEYAGKARGGKGIVGWIFRLPWGEPSFTAQVLAMIIFAAGGVSGVVNASYNINLLVHNTTWIPGHFHLTVGTASALTFMGVTYWLLPYITKRRLFSKPLALAQGWTWFIGMLLFGRGMHWAGLMGAPRRVPFSQAAYTQQLLQGTADLPLGGFQTAMALTAIGGTILFISGVLFLVVFVGSLLTRKGTATDIDVPLAEAYSGPENAPAVLDQWRVWIGGAVVLILISYGPALYSILQASAWNAPGLLIR